MNKTQPAKFIHYFFALCCLSALCQSVVPACYAQESAFRTELKRTDLSANQDMEVITSIVEFKPGDFVGKHFHHGIEAGYVLQGALVQEPGKEPHMLATGTPILNQRDAAHAGFTVVGNQNLKIYTVHIVDKNKPLYDYVK